MKKIIVILAVLAMLMTTVLAVNAASATEAVTCAYKVGDEFITFVQADDTKYVTVGSTWAVKDVAGAMGDKALENNGPKATNANGDGITINFQVPADGQYTVWARVKYPNHSSNSLFWSIDGGDAGNIWDFPDEDDTAACYNEWQYLYLTERVPGTYTDTTKYGEWTIANNEWRHSPKVLELKAGQHTFKLTAREFNTSGIIIDELVVTTYTTEEYDPNQYQGNDNFLQVCKFCGTSWKHYYKDIFSGMQITAQSYFKTTLQPTAVAWEIPAMTTAATTTVVTTTKATTQATTKAATTAAATTAAATTAAATTAAEEGGCGSMIALPAVALITAMSATCCVVKRRNRK